MKTTMKKWMVAILCVFAVCTSAQADNDKPITVNQLPTMARQLIQKNFAGRKVALAVVESGLIDKSYEVIFTNGEKVEFDRNGDWTEISCKTTAVPAALVPAAIASYVRSNYPSVRILKIERDRKKYEVNLANGIELEFDKKFRLTDIDH